MYEDMHRQAEHGANGDESDEENIIDQLEKKMVIGEKMTGDSKMVDETAPITTVEKQEDDKLLNDLLDDLMQEV